MLPDFPCKFFNFGIRDCLMIFQLCIKSGIRQFRFLIQLGIELFAGLLGDKELGNNGKYTGDQCYDNCFAHADHTTTTLE